MGKPFTVGARQGVFPGMLERRIFEVVWVYPGRTAGVPAMDNVPDARVVYAGGEIVLTRGENDEE